MVSELMMETHQFKGDGKKLVEENYELWEENDKMKNDMKKLMNDKMKNEW